MKNRVLNLLLVFAVIICMMPLAAFADETCNHEDTRTETIEANCTREGSVRVICRTCHEVVSETILPTTDHQFLSNIKNGTVCVVCRGDKCDLGVHDYVITREEAATCIVPAYVWKECALCGDMWNGETTTDPNAHTNFVSNVCECGYVCTHEETSTDTVEATCKEEGYTNKICTLCATVVSETVLPTTNDHVFLNDETTCRRCGANKQDVCEHDYETTDEIIGNCNMTGWVWETCKLCGKENERETDIVANAHNYLNGRCTNCFAPCLCDMERVEIQQATCAAEGYRRVICVKCSKVLDETILEKTNEHNFEDGDKCSLCNANLQDVCEHDYETVRELAGTCVEAGYVWLECSLCNFETNHETEIDPDGHDYEIVDQEAPTCVQSGHVSKKCTLCDNEMDEVVAATGHSYESGKCTACGAPDPDCTHENRVEDTAQYRAATCTVDGVRVYNCPDCETEQREIIPMLGHNLVESGSDATCTVNGGTYVNCLRCESLLESEIIPATGHNFVDGTCSVCGAADPDYVPCDHSGVTTHTVAPSCTAAGYIKSVCADCGELVDYERIAATGHSYQNGVCSVCGVRDPEKLTIDYQDIYIVG